MPGGGPGIAWQNACTAEAGFGRKLSADHAQHARGAQRNEAVARLRRCRCRWRSSALSAAACQRRRGTVAEAKLLSHVGCVGCRTIRCLHTDAASASGACRKRRAACRTSRGFATSSHERTGCIGHVGIKSRRSIAAEGSPSGVARVAVCREHLGLVAATHWSFGAVKPGITIFPVISLPPGRARSSPSHSATERPSFHRMAGRRTRSNASNSVAPCICPERPMPRTAAQSRSARTQIVQRRREPRATNPLGSARSTADAAAKPPATRRPARQPRRPRR